MSTEGRRALDLLTSEAVPHISRHRLKYAFPRTPILEILWPAVFREFDSPFINSTSVVLLGTIRGPSATSSVPTGPLKHARRLMTTA